MGAGMGRDQQQTIFERLGVTPVINARGIYTDLGGSSLSPTVWQAMVESNRYFVDMPALLERSGRIIADLVGAPAARITPGASAALVLGTAACLAGTDGEKSERLPDTTGMKHEVLIQRRHRYKYDRCVSLTGARLVEVGDDQGTRLDQLATAIGPDTAAICFPAHLDGLAGTVPLHEVAPLGRVRGVPTLVDAAYLNYPHELMASFTEAGADLVCFSAKYYGGPNAAGFICGRADFIDAVAAVDFTRFESGAYRKFGRPFKLDRQTIVATVVALQEWLATDHAIRFATYARQVQTISDYLTEIPFVTTEPLSFTMDERLEPTPVNCLRVEIDPGAATTVERVAQTLRDGTPSILVHIVDEALVVDVEMVYEGDEELIGARLRDALRV